MSQSVLEDPNIATETGFEGKGVRGSSESSIPKSYSPIRDKKIHWTPLIFIGGAHLLAIVALFNFTWKALFVCVVLHWITGGLGITLGYHRLLTHRSFRAPKAVEYFLTIVAMLACQGGPISWVTAHRLHHAKSDQEEDPHSPLKGFFWAHMGWCIVMNRRIDELEERARLAPDLYNDPAHQFLEKTHILWTILLGAALYALGGWPFVLWGIFMRLVLVYHSTWFVNSAAHKWGYRTYMAGDQSTNLWWVALLTYGEGWHNNHHAFQYSARHGLKWWEFDSTYLTIQCLKFFGLATAIKIPSKELLSRTFAPGKEVLLQN